jgi:hypothetical protein
MGDQPEITVAEAAGVGIDGRPRPTEDHVVTLPNAVLLLDGATALRPGARSGGWYAERLSVALAERLIAAPQADLTEVLAAAITEVAATYELCPGAAPSSTVAMLRWTDDAVDALVLADSPVIVFTDDGPDALLDERLAALRSPGGGYRGRLRGGGGYGPEHVAALRAGGASMSRLRNVAGGFWVAEADPAAAAQAFTRRWPRQRVRAVLVASDGVSCGVDDYGLFDWPEALDIAERNGPADVLSRVREAERADPDGVRWPRPKRHDDQALVLVRFVPAAS